MIAHDPLHGSGRAGLPHPALASGDDAVVAHYLPPHVPAPAHCARRSGAASGTRFAGAGSPWPVPFPPPPPPPPRGRLCSETSAVLRHCPTSHARSSSAYVLDFPDTACRSICRRRYHGTSRFSNKMSFRACAGSMTARDRLHLALAMQPLLPSASSHGVGFSKLHSFAARYPACTNPCPTLRRLLSKVTA